LLRWRHIVAFTKVLTIYQTYHTWFYIKSCIENTSTIFTVLTSFFYPPPLTCDFPLAWPVFHSIAIFVLGLYSVEQAFSSSLVITEPNWG
jgi:hypothetical protein